MGLSSISGPDGANSTSKEETLQLRAKQLSNADDIFRIINQYKNDPFRHCKLQFSSQIKDSQKAGLNGRVIHHSETKIDDSKDGKSNKITTSYDADGNIICVKTTSPDGCHEKVVYYGENGEPGSGYSLAADPTMCGLCTMRGLTYFGGKEIETWATK